MQYAALVVMIGGAIGLVVAGIWILIAAFLRSALWGSGACSSRS
jgi:hypothetical protein